jgi:predicted TIM-barrel fold metal-dependent hydrolase
LNGGLPHTSIFLNGGSPHIDLFERRFAPYIELFEQRFVHIELFERQLAPYTIISTAQANSYIILWTATNPNRFLKATKPAPNQRLHEK